MSHQRQLFRLDTFVTDETTLSPPQWLTQASTPKLVKRLAETLSCDTADLFDSVDGELYVHPASLVIYLLTAVPESGLTLQQLAPPAGRQREHVEFALSRFFNDEISMLIAGSKPADDA